MLPSLEVLDMKTKDGEDYEDESDGDEDEFDLEEGGEDEMEEHVAQLEAKLTDEQKKKLEDAGVTLEQYLNGEGPELGIEFDDEDDEEGEEDAYGDEEGDQDGEDDGEQGEKRQKTE